MVYFLSPQTRHLSALLRCPRSLRASTWPALVLRTRPRATYSTSIPLHPHRHRAPLGLARNPALPHFPYIPGHLPIIRIHPFINITIVIIIIIMDASTSRITLTMTFEVISVGMEDSDLRLCRRFLTMPNVATGIIITFILTMISMMRICTTSSTSLKTWLARVSRKAMGLRLRDIDATIAHIIIGSAGRTVSHPMVPRRFFQVLLQLRICRWSSFPLRRNIYRRCRCHYPVTWFLVNVYRRMWRRAETRRMKPLCLMMPPLNQQRPWPPRASIRLRVKTVKWYWWLRFDFLYRWISPWPMRFRNKVVSLISMSRLLS